MKKFLAVLFAVIIIAGLLFIFVFKGCQGSGDGAGSDHPTESINTDQQEVSSVSPSPSISLDESDDDLSQSTDAGQTAPDTANSNEIIVRIEDRQVFVNGKECKDAEELKNYIEEISDDEKIFKLEEEHAILATYEWVTEVFHELGIDLIGSI